MTTLNFTLPTGITAQITSDCDMPFMRKERLLFEAYVPGIRVTEPMENPDLCIRYERRDKKTIFITENEVIIGGKEQTFIPTDAYHLLYSMSRKALLKKNLFTVHAACVETDGLALIIGHTGTGKTTVAMELLKNYDCRIYSGNKTVVNFDNGINAIAGTTTMTVKRTSYQTGLEGSIDYDDRTAFGLRTEQYAPPGHITNNFIVKIDDRNKIEEITALDAMHRLYPFFLDMVNADTIIERKYVYDGACSLQQKEYLTKQFAVSTTLGRLNRVRSYIVTGSPTFIASEINAK